MSSSSSSTSLSPSQVEYWDSLQLDEGSIYYMTPTGTKKVRDVTSALSTVPSKSGTPRAASDSEPRRSATSAARARTDLKAMPPPSASTREKHISKEKKPRTNYQLKFEQANREVLELTKSNEQLKTDLQHERERHDALRQEYKDAQTQIRQLQERLIKQQEEHARYFKEEAKRNAKDVRQVQIQYTQSLEQQQQSTMHLLKQSMRQQCQQAQHVLQTIQQLMKHPPPRTYSREDVIRMVEDARIKYERETGQKVTPQQVENEFSRRWAEALLQDKRHQEWKSALQSQRQLLLQVKQKATELAVVESGGGASSPSSLAGGNGAVDSELQVQRIQAMQAIQQAEQLLLPFSGSSTSSATSSSAPASAACGPAVGPSGSGPLAVAASPTAASSGKGPLLLTSREQGPVQPPPSATDDLD